MCGRSVSDALPQHFKELIRTLGDSRNSLRDTEHHAQPDDYSRAQAALETNLAFLAERLFPLHGINPV
jgi:acetoin utilization protein AcuC